MIPNFTTVKETDSFTRTFNVYLLSKEMSKVSEILIEQETPLFNNFPVDAYGHGYDVTDSDIDHFKKKVGLNDSQIATIKQSYFVIITDSFKV